MIKKSTLPAGLAALCFTGSLPAAVLMLDFGPTVAIDDVGAANSLLNSPYHTANVSFTQDDWNQVQTADIAAGGLLWADGTVATGIALNIGATTTTGKVLGLANTPSVNSALGSFTSTGVYADTSVGKDGISTGSGTALRAVGFQLSGLATGAYDIFITARNTSLSGALTQNLYVGKAASAGTSFDFTGYATQSLAYANSSAATGSWSEGANYVKFSISITAGEVLNLASFGAAGTDQRGFLNSVQIVSAIPEPSSFALFGGAAALLFVAGARRRQRAA